MPEKQKPVTIVTNEADNITAGHAFGYLVDSQGSLIEKVAIKKGETSFKTPLENLGSGTRLFIGSDIPKEIGDKKISSNLLMKMKSKEIPFHLSSDNKVLLPSLSPIIFPKFQLCTIKGALSKTFEIDSIAQVLPICDARVHICEVDPVIWWWPRIPDLVISDLIEKLKKVIEIPRPIPIPDPGPIKPNFPLSGLPFNRNILLNKPVMLNKTMLHKNFTVPSLSNFNPVNISALPALPENVKNGIKSSSISVAQNTVLQNIKLLHPYICMWPKFWPWLYKCDEIAVVNTDCHGKFDHTYFYFENGDKPDIYIWVEVNIDGQWVTVYKPSLPCGTDWDYVCGTDINLRLTDPRIRPCVCEPLTGSIIWMKNVNTGTSIRSIQQNNAASGNQANAVGLNNYMYNGINYKMSPFASSFPFVVQFGSAYPNANSTHYRWKYRRVKDALLQDVTENFTYLEGEIAKPYTYELPNGNFATKSFPLGANYDVIDSKNVPKYKIPHVHATDDVPESTAEWNQDTYSINVNSKNLNDGLYEFVFELTDNSGNVIAVNADDYVVTRNDAVDPPRMFPDEATIKANGLPENYLMKNPLGMAIGFRFLMRIDNLQCYANVIDALVGAGTTDTECGFGYFDAAHHNATLRFFAGHDRNFGVYSFNLTKGNSNTIAIAGSANMASLANNGYSKTTVQDADHGFALEDLFQKSFDVNDLLGSCPQAAFAESLYVSSTHTDGTNHLYHLDASDTAAIAIAPTP